MSPSRVGFGRGLGGRRRLRHIGGMKTLVMIPALGCDGALYREIVPALSGLVHCRTVVADAGSLAACVGQVLAAVEGPFIVMGTSFGGRVALETALAEPGRVQGLVVIGAGPGPVADPVAGRRRSERLRGGEFEPVVAEMGAIISHLPGPNGPATREAFIAMCRNQGNEVMARQSDALASRTDVWPRLPEIACPALMLWGQHDQFSPAADGLRVAAAVTRGRYVELAACGHFPTLEYPDETAAAIGHWLQDSTLA
jgi:pimeloyl-ACP methyl ester carboxylesterase